MSTSFDFSLALNYLNLKTSPYKKPLEMFHLFSSLAPELRLKIWSFACSPRVLPIKYHSTTITTFTSFAKGGRKQKTVSRFTSSAIPPALLSVSTESRAQALTIYFLTFSTPTAPGTIYFSPVHDMLYFPRHRDMGYDETARDFRILVSKDGLENGTNRSRERGVARNASTIWDDVRSIAIDYVDINIKRPWESYNKACLIRSFPQLENIYLVVGQPGDATSAIYHLEDADVHRSNIKRKKQVMFSSPRTNPEKLLRWWAGFRQSFVMEERMLEDASIATGNKYDKFVLPTIKMVGRCG